MNISKKSILINFLYLIFIFGVLFLLTITCYYIYLRINDTVTDINKYSKALHNIRDKEMIKHFPVTIPTDASNISLYEHTDIFNDSEIILLKFKTNQNFINKELKNNTFIKGTRSKKSKKVYSFPQINQDFKTNNYTYYVINNQTNKECYNDFFPCFNGIGINQNEILYYYFSPSD